MTFQICSLISKSQEWTEVDYVADNAHRPPLHGFAAAERWPWDRQTDRQTDGQRHYGITPLQYAYCIRGQRKRSVQTRKSSLRSVGPIC